MPRPGSRLTGSRGSDWAAFAAVYSQVISQVPQQDVQQVAEATMTGMVAALDDNHACWSYPAQPPGPSPATSEDARLIGAFEHGTPYQYDCTVTGQCTADYPDASIPLLHLPLVVLDNSDCVSGCEVFAGAVKDLHLGTLIGTRTAGIVAGGALPWVLDDGSQLGLPPKHGLGADHELINGIGVAPTITSLSPRWTWPPARTPTSPRRSPCSRPEPGSHGSRPAASLVTGLLPGHRPAALRRLETG